MNGLGVDALIQVFWLGMSQVESLIRSESFDVARTFNSSSNSALNKIYLMHAWYNRNCGNSIAQVDPHLVIVL